MPVHVQIIFVIAYMVDPETKNYRYDIFTGGIALWELVDNFHTFVHLSGAVEHDDLVTSVGVVCGGKRAVSSGADRWCETPKKIIVQKF